MRPKPSGPFDLPPLNALRVFEASARLGSFKAAAVELCVTPSAVSHQVAKIESFLSTTLFRRDGRGLRLTHEGEVYQRDVHETLARLSRATQGLTGDDSETPLVIGSAPSFAGKWLLPRLSHFMAEHPDLSIRLEASPDRAAIADADISILHGDVRGRVTGAIPLIAERLEPLCSPALLADGPPLETPADLENHVLIQTRNPIQWQAWMLARGLDFPIRQDIWLERSSMAIEAAAAGHGVILESNFLTADELSSGRLIRPFKTDHLTKTHTAYFLVERSGAEPNWAMLRFADWIQDQVPPEFRPRN